MRNCVKKAALLFAVLAAFLLNGCQYSADAPSITVDDVPAYAGEPYVVLYENQPDFDTDDFTLTAFEYYSSLDYLGRCGTAYANVCQELMPTEDRESISQIRPSGWQSVRYDFVEGGSLYNRCHLIGFQLTGENANEQNLITGTRYMNVVGMLPFETMVANYVKETGNHVLYRVTPVYSGSDLVASGVWMEAMSVEDEGEGVCFCVYVYNVQPGVLIDYATGESELDETFFSAGEARHYVLNTGSRRFHLPECTGVLNMKEENKQDYTGTRELLIAQGYSPCGNCKP